MAEVRRWRHAPDAATHIVRRPTTRRRRALGHPALLVAGELVVLALWTLVITRPYLDADPYVVPAGRDFVHSTLGHHLWTHARDCGLCALWNGDVRGGTPALVDPLGATLHPLTAVSTFGWGFVNGAKLVLVVSFFLTGVGQWALGRALGAGRPARLWGAAMAIAAGHLFGAMSTGGLLPVVVSLSAATMLLATLVHLAQRPRRRLTVVAGVLAGLLLVSGQGYIQIVFGLLIPVFALLVAGRVTIWRRFLRELLLAGGLGALLAAPFLVPFLHFYPDYAKGASSTFARAQPFGYAALNLVIDDAAFYQSETLGKMTFPEWYLNFIGWPAVLLAVCGTFLLWRRGDRRLALFLPIYAVGALWLSAAGLFRWVHDHPGPVPSLAEFTVGIQTPSIMAKLAVPPLLALATVAIDRLVRLSPVRLAVRAVRGRRRGRGWIAVRLWPGWIALPLAVVVLLQLRSAGQPWISTERFPEDEITAVTRSLETADLQWVQPPIGEPAWVPAAIEANLKLAYYHRAWGWEGGRDPEPVLVVSRGDEAGLTRIGGVADLGVYEAPPGREYAAVEHADGSRTPCVATGEGGDIDVACVAPAPGLLVVREHTYDGWQARVNGQDHDVGGSGQWLAVEVPAGSLDVRLRYRPADVALGAALMTVGIGLGIFWLVGPGPAHAPVPSPARRRRPEVRRRRSVSRGSGPHPSPGGSGPARGGSGR